VEYSLAQDAVRNLLTFSKRPPQPKQAAPRPPGLPPQPQFQQQPQQAPPPPPPQQRPGGLFGGLFGN